MRAEAGGIRRAGGPRPESPGAQRELHDLLRVIAGRAGTTRAILVDDRLRVVATGTATVPVGNLVAEPVIVRAVNQRRAVDGVGRSPRAGDSSSGAAATRTPSRASGSATPAPPGRPTSPSCSPRCCSRAPSSSAAAGSPPPTSSAHTGRSPTSSPARRRTRRATSRALSLILLRADGRLGRRKLDRVARILQDGRLGDRAFRAGPGAFAVLLPRTGLEGAVEVAHRVTHRLSRAGVPLRAAAGSLQPGQDADGLHADVDRRARRRPGLRHARGRRPGRRARDRRARPRHRTGHRPQRGRPDLPLPADLAPALRRPPRRRGARPRPRRARLRRAVAGVRRRRALRPRARARHAVRAPGAGGRRGTCRPAPRSSSTSPPDPRPRRRRRHLARRRGPAAPSSIRPASSSR